MYRSIRLSHLKIFPKLQLHHNLLKFKINILEQYGVNEYDTDSAGQIHVFRY